MPDPLAEYRKVLSRAREQFRRGPRLEAERAYYREFARLLSDLYRLSRTGRLSAEAARALERSIKSRLRRLQSLLDEQMADAVKGAAESVGEAHTEGVGRAAAAAGVTMAFALPFHAERTTILIRMRAEVQGFAGTFEDLLKPKFLRLDPDIDAFVRHAVERGATWQAATVDLAKIMARDNASVLSALDELGPTGRRLRREILRAQPLRDLDLKEARQILHRARRVIVSEQNSARHLADLVAAQRSPAIDLVRWTLSGRHADLWSSPDVCDLVAEHDSGYGSGLYVPQACPSLLHPYCECSAYPVFRAVRDWRRPKREAIEPSRVRASEARQIMRRRTNRQSGRLTPTRIKRQSQQANKMIRGAYVSYRNLTKRRFQIGGRAA